MTLNYASGNGCTVLAASLHANTSLLLLKLDGNPVGAAGAKEMVTLTLPGDDDETQVDQYDAKEAMESAKIVQRQIACAWVVLTKIVNFVITLCTTMSLCLRARRSRATLSRSCAPSSSILSSEKTCHPSLKEP